MNTSTAPKLKLYRMLEEAKTSANECNRLMSRIEKPLTSDDISSLTSAANQAAQAAKEINQILGYLEAMRSAY